MGLLYLFWLSSLSAYQLVNFQAVNLPTGRRQYHFPKRGNEIASTFPKKDADTYTPR